LVLGLLALAGVRYVTSMPGEPYSGPLPPLTDSRRDLADRLRRRVKHLADDVGPRTVMGRYEALLSAERYLADSLAAMGYEPKRQAFEVAGKEVANIEAVLPGRGRGTIVLGAHYDTVSHTRGADDNASAVAVLLELAGIAQNNGPFAKSIRFVGFVNEEPPFFQTRDMGSRRYASDLRRRGVGLDAVIVLESLGYFDDTPGSQRYPAPLSLVYPDTGDFIAFVGNLGSLGLTRKLTRLFREKAAFPSQGGALPGWLPGIGWSDHWSFWKEGYDAVMVTDTALFRNPNYHMMTDVPETLDYERMAVLAVGLAEVLESLAENKE
jgi:Zn-dependent M28 family amino/carboxypeptidase